MKCVICKSGETQPGLATVVLHRGNTVVVTKGVPAEICGNCGEYYLESSVSESIFSKAEQAAMANAEVEILQYAA